MQDGRKVCPTGFYDAVLIAFLLGFADSTQIDVLLKKAPLLINFSRSNLDPFTVVDWRVLWSRKKFRQMLPVKV